MLRDELYSKLSLHPSLPIAFYPFLCYCPIGALGGGGGIPFPNVPPHPDTLPDPKMYLADPLVQ